MFYRYPVVFDPMDFLFTGKEQFRQLNHTLLLFLVLFLLIKRDKITYGGSFSVERSH